MNKYINLKKLPWCLRFYSAGTARAKHIANILAAVCFSVSVAAQPKINRVEYFVDNDPGYGHGTALSITPAADLSNLSFNVSLGPLNQGVHIIGVRSRDANGAWSLDNKWLFVKPYANGAALPVPKVNRVEYYIDEDPGYGSATPITITPGTNLTGLAISIALGPLNQGVHIVGVRSRDANGAWSLDNKWLFVKPYAGGVSAPVPNIKRVEYFIDEDPGYGHGTALTITAAPNLSNLSFNINMNPLNVGVHNVIVRSKDANGAWSLDNHWLFLKPYPAGKSTKAPKIKRVEYYVDNDPGYGQATNLSITPGVDLSNLSFNISLNSLSQGVHIVGVRSKDSIGSWSLDNKWLFVKPYGAGSTPPQPKINRIEYYVDVDPGYGHGTAVSITPAKDLANQTFPVNIASLNNGPHFIGVRSRDENGAWSLDNKYAITISGHLVAIAPDQTSMKTEALSNKLALQFNPVHQNAVLLYTTTENDKVQIRVVDGAGKVVSTKQVDVFKGVNPITLQTASLAQSLYIIQTVSEKNVVMSTKMLKQ